MTYACSIGSGANTLFYNYDRISKPDLVQNTSQRDQVKFIDSGVLWLSDQANSVRGNALDTHGIARGAGILFKYFKRRRGHIPDEDPINIGRRLLFNSACHSIFVMWRLVDSDELGERVYIQVRKSKGRAPKGECVNPKYRHIDKNKWRIALPNSALDKKNTFTKS